MRDDRLTGRLLQLSLLFLSNLTKAIADRNHFHKPIREAGYPEGKPLNKMDLINLAGEHVRGIISINDLYVAFISRCGGSGSFLDGFRYRYV